MNFSEPPLLFDRSPLHRLSLPRRASATRIVVPLSRPPRLHWRYRQHALARAIRRHEPQEFTMSMHLYRGFEIYPLIYPHVPAQLGSAHNYDAGFDAAVKICQRGAGDMLTRSQTFRLAELSPFDTAGDARRASLRYAETMIDDNRDKPGFFADTL